ncbi:MAG: deoxyribodipyrimidine photo-lyase [Rhizobiales bacterium]|nr:deoxyribodipyrimidine photo-lyase [Hyphomicrobiales bacterium]
MTTVVWFRNDLRVSDHPALAHAAKRGPVIPVYILDDTDPWPLGGASRWWLHHSLASLQSSLGGLVLLRGDPRQLIPELAEKAGAEAVCWNRAYEPHAVARDTEIKAALSAAGLDTHSFKGNVLHEPWEVETGAGGPFKVYTPFWRAAQRRDVEPPLGPPDMRLGPLEGHGHLLADWSLLPTSPNWAEGWEDLWHPGESGAQERLAAFLLNDLKGYGELRDRPDLPNVSRLSPHLHFGEISPRQIWSQTRFAADQDAGLEKDASKFLSEVGWREFATHLLFHFPTLPDKNWRPAFDAFPWQNNPAHLAAWQKGQTGYPFVDAGLRELWHTGTMHNRVRMVAASFLIKHLQIHWQHGEAWFWDTLLDADLANNSAGWQWVAGSGADASPYFRIFNPITQGRKFDPDGAYVRRWCPELAELPTELIHAPFDAPDAVLALHGVVLGETYPHPLVDHASARAAALKGYEAVKAAAGG